MPETQPEGQTEGLSLGVLWALSASDQHFNEAGHRSIARQFADAILEGHLTDHHTR
jgi:hypothetical protein